jgi:hypothetical protein
MIASNFAPVDRYPIPGMLTHNPWVEKHVIGECELVKRT